jgi:nucleotide-binding universal stress UspA family protein
MYQRILVPVDGSSTSDRALQEAIKLIDTQPAQLRLVHVIDDLQFLDTEGYVDYAALRELTQQIGVRTLARAEEVAKQANIAVETALLEANGERIARVIDKDALSWGADLIVIGTHGRAGFNHLLFGSVAEGVVRGASVPVLLVRSE